MRSGHDTATIPPAVEDTLCSDPDVEFAVAFGSRVEDTARPSSDLDIAVKFSEELSAEDRFRKRCRLSGHVQQPDAPFVDLSDIDDLPLEVAHEAVRGDLICGDETMFQAVKRDIEAEFDETRGQIEQRHRDVIHRIAEDGLHG